MNMMLETSWQQHLTTQPKPQTSRQLLASLFAGHMLLKNADIACR
jgi:hypothetical protein